MSARPVSLVLDTSAIAAYATTVDVGETINDLFGAGDPQNRLPKAVQRTMPFAMLAQTIPLLWYAHAGNTEADIAARRASAPWYQHKTHASLEDMLIAFRRARIPQRPRPIPQPNKSSPPLGPATRQRHSRETSG